MIPTSHRRARASNRPIVGAHGLALALVVLTAADAEPAGRPQAPTLDLRIVALTEEISPDSLAATLRHLATFGTRHTQSVSDSTGWGITAARQWILETMRGYSDRLDVEFDSYAIPAQGRITEAVELRNVMAVLPGRTPRRIYVSGHYDSLSRPAGGGAFDSNRWDNVAPGVNDDGSGTALTMELARVFSQSGIEFDATLVFLTVAGEEEGLVGARLHAQEAARNGTPIDAVFNNDIVGNVTGGNGIVDGRTVRVFSGGPMDSNSRQLARFIRRHASLYVPWHQVRLIAREDRFGRGGDHTAFNQVGYAGVRFTESRENYSRQHTVDDTFEGVSPEYLARNAMVNIAPMATMAIAPQAPYVLDARGAPMLGRGESGYDTHMKWNRADGAVGYRVFWREAWTPDWQHELTVSDTSELTLPDVSIDDFIFGVASVGPGGHESMVTAYIRPPRSFEEVERSN